MMPLLPGVPLGPIDPPSEAELAGVRPTRIFAFDAEALNAVNTRIKNSLTGGLADGMTMLSVEVPALDGMKERSAPGYGEMIVKIEEELRHGLRGLGEPTVAMLRDTEFVAVLPEKIGEPEFEKAANELRGELAAYSDLSPSALASEITIHRADLEEITSKRGVEVRFRVTSIGQDDSYEVLRGVTKSPDTAVTNVLRYFEGNSDEP